MCLRFYIYGKIPTSDCLFLLAIRPVTDLLLLHFPLTPVCAWIFLYASTFMAAFLLAPAGLYLCLPNWAFTWRRLCHPDSKRLILPKSLPTSTWESSCQTAGLRLCPCLAAFVHMSATAPAGSWTPGSVPACLRLSYTSFLTSAPEPPCQIVHVFLFA
jgi:hypothetical protein